MTPSASAVCATPPCRRRPVGLIVAAAVAWSAAFDCYGGSGTPPDHLTALEPAIVEYRWVFLVPEWVVEAGHADARVYAPAVRPRRIDYGVVELATSRRRIGRMADFSCKYSDFALPNACRTTWRDVYADVPVPVVRRDYIDLDVPQWSWQRWRATYDVPRLVWKRAELVVSLPAIAVRTAPDP